jgi:hypothetical protein
MKFRFLSFLLVCFGVFGFCFFSSLNQTKAVESSGLALSPPTFELSANPGDVLENTIRLENLTERSMKIAVDKRNFTALGEEGGIDFTTEDEEASFSLASWVTVFPSEAEIGPKKTITFTFRTEIPLNAEPGGHFGSIVFKTGGAMPGQTGAALSQELGALVLLRVAGKATEKAFLESFNSNKKIWEKGPVEFEIRVRNQGNVHIKPIGIITITDFFGKKVDSFNIEPKNVLPGSIRKSTAVWNKKFLIGKYNATVILNYGIQNQMISGSTTFIAFPYKIGGIILAVLLILGAFLYRIRERLKLALKVLRGKYK